MKLLINRIRLKNTDACDVQNHDKCLNISARVYIHLSSFHPLLQYLLSYKATQLIFQALRFQQLELKFNINRFTLTDTGYNRK